MTSTYFHASVRGPVERSAKRSVLINLMDERSLKRFFFENFKMLSVWMCASHMERAGDEKLKRLHEVTTLGLVTID